MSDKAAPITAMHSAKICSTLPVFLQTADLTRYSGCVHPALGDVSAVLMRPLHESPALKDPTSCIPWCDGNPHSSMGFIRAERTLW